MVSRPTLDRTMLGVRAGRQNAAVPGTHRLVELSHEICHGMVTYPGLPGPKISDYLSREGSPARYRPGTEIPNRADLDGGQQLSVRGQPAHTALLGPEYVMPRGSVRGKSHQASRLEPTSHAHTELLRE
jgi:hypothetical protein